MAQNYVLGQGKVYLDEIDATTKLPVGKARWIGNVPNGGLTMDFTTDSYTHQESYTGNRLTDLKIERGKMLEGNLIIEDLSKENLETFLYGTGATVTGTTVTDETHKGFAGLSFQLANINLSSFTSLTGTGGTPTYINGTDFTVNLKSGRVTILATSSITDDTDLEASYVMGDYDRVTAFTTPNREFWLTFDGVNNADGDKPVVVDVFRIRLDPPSGFDWLTEEPIPIEMSFEGLYEETLASLAGYEGGFFRYRKLAAV